MLLYIHKILGDGITETAIKEKGLNQDTIKYFAIIAMTLNHIANIFMPYDSLLTHVFINIGYVTAVVMCRFLVDGFYYTSSRKKYAIRLAVFAVISELPYCWAFSPKGTFGFQGTNMMFTLLLCLFILEIKERPGNKAIKAGFITAIVLFSVISDWGITAPVMTLLFSWSRGSQKKSIIALGISMLIFCTINYLALLDELSVGFSTVSIIMAVTAITAAGTTVIFFYNGKRSEKHRAFSKWFFYVYYPAHLVLFAFINQVILK